MTKRERPKAFIDWYAAHGIIPTHIEDKSLRSFFAQRDYLFRRLGVTRSAIRKGAVLEIGSGTGQKAQHLLSYGPASYLAIDGNPESVRRTTKALEDFNHAVEIWVELADFTQYAIEQRFDLVIAEALIPTQQNPAGFLRRVGECVNPGGILIITTMDSLSLLPELLRRFLARHVRLVVNSQLESSAARVAAFFSEDLDQLVGMSRSRLDWAIDQIIHPWTGPLFGLDESFTVLEGFSLLGTSPTLYPDLRWYKEIALSDEADRSWNIQQYWESCHLLLDRRLDFTRRRRDENVALKALTDSIYELIVVNELSEFSQALESNLRSLMTALPSECSKLRDAIEGVFDFVKGRDSSSLEPFRRWWGRGQQYASFVRG